MNVIIHLRHLVDYELVPDSDICASLLGSYVDEGDISKGRISFKIFRSGVSDL